MLERSRLRRVQVGEHVDVWGERHTWSAHGCPATCPPTLPGVSVNGEEGASMEGDLTGGFECTFLVGLVVVMPRYITV